MSSNPPPPRPVVDLKPTGAYRTTVFVADPYSVGPPKSPFKGIWPFHYTDQGIFFAREAEVEKLLRYVAVYRGVLFYGASGSGKSSLINAGFIPKIIREGLTPDVIRVQPRLGEEIIIQRISLRAEGGPPYLPSNFAPVNERDAHIFLSASEFAKRIRQLPSSNRALLIFDQFEEFATLFEEVSRGPLEKDVKAAQESLLQVLVDLLRDGTLPVKLLFVFREDYLAKLSKLFDRYPALLEQHLRLLPPRIESLHEIIRGSFERFPEHFEQKISASLAKRLADAINERTESNRLNLSEVQIVCLELWKSDDPDMLFKERGIQGLLEDHLSSSLLDMDEHLRDPAVLLLSRMVTPSGTRNIVSEYDLTTQASKEENVPEALLKEALKALVSKTRLIRQEPRYKTFYYDIVSEFLVPWISQKKEERRAERERLKLEEAERQKRRKAYRIATLCLIFALGIGVIAWLIVRANSKGAMVEKYRGEKMQAESERNQALVKLQETVAEKSVTDQERANQLADAKQTIEQDKAYITSLEADLNLWKMRAQDVERGTPAVILDGQPVTDEQLKAYVLWVKMALNKILSKKYQNPDNPVLSQRLDSNASYDGYALRVVKYFQSHSQYYPKNLQIDGIAGFRTAQAIRQELDEIDKAKQ